MFEDFRLMQYPVAKTPIFSPLITLCEFNERVIMLYIIYMLILNMGPMILLKIPLHMLFVLIFILTASYFIQSYPNKL